MARGSDLLDSGNDVSAQRLERTFRKQFWSVLVPLIAVYSLLCFFVPAELPADVREEHAQWVEAQARFAALQTGFLVPLEDDTEIIAEYGEEVVYEAKHPGAVLVEAEAFDINLDTADELRLSYGAPRVTLTQQQREEELPQLMETLESTASEDVTEAQLRERATWALASEEQMEPLLEEWRAFAMVNAMRAGAISTVRDTYPVMEGKFYGFDSVQNLMWNWALYDAAKAEAELHLELIVNPDSEHARENIGKYQHQMITLSDSDTGIGIVGEWFCNALSTGECPGQNDRAPLRGMLRRADYTEVGIARVPLKISTIELQLRQRLNKAKRSLEATQDGDDAVNDGSTAAVQASLKAALSDDVRDAIRAGAEEEIRQLEEQLLEEKEKKTLDISFLWVAFFGNRQLPERKSNIGVVSAAHFVLPNPKYDAADPKSSPEQLMFLAGINLEEGQALSTAKAYINGYGPTMHTISRSIYTGTRVNIDFISNLRRHDGCLSYHAMVGTAEGDEYEFPTSHKFVVRDLPATAESCRLPFVIPREE